MDALSSFPPPMHKIKDVGPNEGFYPPATAQGLGSELPEPVPRTRTVLSSIDEEDPQTMLYSLCDDDVVPTSALPVGAYWDLPVDEEGFQFDREDILPGSQSLDPYADMDEAVAIDMKIFDKLSAQRRGRMLDPPPFESLKESLRLFKAGWEIRGHVFGLPSMQRTGLIAMCRAAVRPDGEAGVAKRKRAPLQRTAVKGTIDIPWIEKDHILRYKNCERIYRPLRFTPGSYLTWLRGESSHIYATYPGKVPVLNMSGVALLGHGDLSPSMRNHMLTKAQVVATSWSELKSVSGSVSVLRRDILIGPLWIQDLDDVTELSTYFRSHKPLLRKTCAFLQGDPSIDAGTLAAELETRVFPKRLAIAAANTLALARACSTAEDLFVSAPPSLKRQEARCVVSLQGNNQNGLASSIAEDAMRSAVGVVDDSGVAERLGRALGSGFVDGARDKVAAVASIDAIRPILNVVLGIGCMALSQTPLQFFMSVMHTVVNDPIAMTFVHRLRGGVELQGPPDGPVDNWWAQLAGLSVFSSIREFLGDVYAALIPSLLEMCGAIKFANMRLFAASIAEALADVLVELFARLRSCYEEGSLQPLLGVDANRWCRHTNGIMQYYEYIVAKGDAKLFKNLASSDELPALFRRHMTHSELLEGLETHIAEGNKLMAVVPAEKKPVLDMLLRKLAAFKAGIGYFIEGNSDRPTPYCVSFYGVPGTGKSTDADELARYVARSEGRSQADIYSYREENFRTNLRASTCVIRMDDPDASVSGTSPGFEDHCAFLQHIVNSSCYSIEQAGVDEKGRHYARPTDVIVATNTKTLRAGEYSIDPGAIWRRIQFWIETSVAPEYATSDGRLDLSKKPPANPRRYTLHRFRSCENRTLITDVVAQDLEWDELVPIILQDREEFLQREYRLIQQHASLCKKCEFSTARCICNKAQVAVVDPKPTGVTMQGAAFDVGAGKVAQDKLLNVESAAFVGTQVLGLGDWRTPLRNIAGYITLSNALGVIAVVSGAIAIGENIAYLIQTYVKTQGRDAGVANDSWFRASIAGEPALPTAPPATWSRDQMLDAVRASLVVVCGESEMNGIIYAPGWVLFPTHAFGKSDLAHVSFRGYDHKFRRDNTKLLLNAEFSVVYIAGLTGCNGVKAYWTPFPINSSKIGDAVLVGTREYTLGACATGVQAGFPVWKYSPVTIGGDCGSVLCANGPGDAPRIFGMHLYGCPVWSGSAQLSKDQIDGVIARETPLRTMYQGGMPALPERLQHYPPLSEVNVAQTYYNTNCLHWGTHRRGGRTIKTQFRPTSFSDKIVEFAKEDGVFCDYGIPEFRGSMVNDRYFSPYIHALRDSNTSPTTYMHCVREYVDRVKGHFGGSLSEKEAIVGVPGEFNSINLKTSMGPPIYGPKSVHIDRDNAEISPEVAAQIDELEEILRRKEVPRLYVEATLKDEVLKRGKNARVFCMLSAAFNAVGKKRFAPLKRAFRSSFFGAQCAVGLDFGSRKCEDFVEFFLHFLYMYDMDLEKMDKMWTPELWDAVAEVVKEITAFSAGEVAGWEAWALVMAMKEAIIDVKGDLFTAFWNPSGNDITVELNSIALSLMMIAVQLITKTSMAINTYGDDLGGGSNTLLPDTFFLDFTALTGFKATDGSKSSTPVATTLEGIVFLKRRFRYDQEYKVWVAPLEVSSVVKMLMFRGKSALSPPDHERELIETAARYLVLQGEETYARWSARLLEVCPEATLPDYRDSMEKYALGQYTDWANRAVAHDGAPGVVQDVVLQGDFRKSSTKTTGIPPPPQLSMHSAMSVPANELKGSVALEAPSTTSPSEQDGTVPIEAGDAVQVVSAGDTQTIPAGARYKVLGSLAEYELSAFPERWVRIGVLPISSSDPYMAGGVTGAIASYSLYDLLFANPAMVDKTTNWSYFRGGLDVLGVVTAPGNASGAYVISCFPRVSEDPIASKPSLTTFLDSSALAYEHKALWLASSSSNIEFKLPYFSAYDANSLSAPSSAGGWTMSVCCLSPLRTAIPGGVTTGSITWYAKLSPGYELLVPKWQGRPVYQGKEKGLVDYAKDLKKSKAISKTSNTIKGIADKLVGVPVLGQAAGMVSMAAGTVSAVADFFGFSRPNDNAALTPFVTRSVKNVALTDGADCADVAGFSMHNKISLEPDLLGGEDADPMSFESMGQRWGLVGAFTWAAINDASTVLKEIPVTPGFGVGDLDNFRVVPAGYCGLPFSYWRAEAEFLVVVPASTLHRGALQVLYIPPDGSAPIAADNITNVGMGAIMDVSAATQFQFHVGFSSNKPMLPLTYFNNSWAIQPVGTANGSIQIRVVNPLRSQNPVDELNVCVFVRFKNVQFAVPRTTFAWPNAANDGLVYNAWEDAVALQGRATGDDADTDPVLSFDLVPGSGPYPITEVVAGEDIRSLRALAQRPSRLITAPQNTTVLVPGVSAFTTGVTVRVTTASLAMSPFVLGAASERIKVFPQKDTWVGCKSYDSRTTLDDLASISAHMPMTFTGPQRGAEFVLPYYFPARGRSWRCFGTPTNAQLQAMERVAVLQVEGLAPEFRAYYSLGDDIRVGGFMRLPAFVCQRTTLGRAGWFSGPV